MHIYIYIYILRMLLLAQLLIGGIFGPSGLSRGLDPWNRALSRGSLKGLLLSKKSSTMRGLGSGVKGPSLRQGFGIKQLYLKVHGQLQVEL